VLLVERGKAPAAGWWGFPGGHVELGETVFAAARRELREEVALEVAPLALLDLLDLVRRDEEGRIERHFVLACVLCRIEAGEPVAGSDAAACAWVDPASLPQDWKVQPEVGRLGQAALRMVKA